MKIPRTLNPAHHVNQLLKSKMGVVPEVKVSFNELLKNASTQYKTLEPDNSHSAGTTGEKKDPWHSFKHQLPALAKQLLGKHYPMVSHMSSRFIAPEQIEQAAERIFEQFAQLAKVVSQTKSIHQRRKAFPVAPNSRQAHTAMHALANKVELENKVIAHVEGAITGVLGVTGAALDVPLMIILALRIIYQTAACYGVELEEDEGLDLALEILAEVDLNLYAQKQVILLALAQAKTMLQESDINRFYAWASQNTDVKRLKRFVTRFEKRLNDKFKPKYIAMHYITPIAAASIAGFYNGVIISKVATQAKNHFKPEKALMTVVQTSKA